MSLEIIPGYDRIDTVRELFTEYTDFLYELDPIFKGYLELQKYDAELLHPEEKYAQPGGRLYIALVDGVPAGCIALRKLDDERCELKRMYVRERFRSQGIARALISRLMEEAAAQGYNLVLLDTLPMLSDAIRLYKSMGFHTVDRYNDSPLDYSVFLGKELI